MKKMNPFFNFLKTIGKNGAKSTRKLKRLAVEEMEVRMLLSASPYQLHPPVQDASLTTSEVIQSVDNQSNDLIVDVLNSAEDLKAEIQVAVLKTASTSDTADSIPQSISAITNGDVLWVEVWMRNYVTPIGEESIPGIAGGYVALNYSGNVSLSSETDAINHGSTFNTMTSPVLDEPENYFSEGRILSLGGFVAVDNDTPYGDNEWVRLCAVKFNATGTNATFTLSTPINELGNADENANIGLNSTSGSSLDSEVINFGSISFPSAPPVTNNNPVAIADTATTAFNTPVTIDVVGNDTDADSDILTVTGVSNVLNGTASVVNNEVVFTPTTNFSGEASFEYAVSDGNGGTATGSVNVTVAAAPVTNNNPVAIADTATTAFNTPVTIDVVGNDTDADSDILTVTGVSNVLNGTASVVNNEVVFTPTTNFSGEASFEYAVSDGNGGTATGSVNVTVAAAPVTNNNPVAIADTATTAFNTPVTIDVVGNDTDADSDILTVTGVSNVLNGTASVVNNEVVFTPTTNFSGDASFEYAVSDGKGGTATGSVNITVAAAPEDAVFYQAGKQIVFASGVASVEGETYTFQYKLSVLPDVATLWQTGTVSLDAAGQVLGSVQQAFLVNGQQYDLRIVDSDGELLAKNNLTLSRLNVPVITARSNATTSFVATLVRSDDNAENLIVSARMLVNGIWTDWSEDLALADLIDNGRIVDNEDGTYFISGLPAGCIVQLRVFAQGAFDAETNILYTNSVTAMSTVVLQQPRTLAVPIAMVREAGTVAANVNLLRLDDVADGVSYRTRECINGVWSEWSEWAITDEQSFRLEGFQAGALIQVQLSAFSNDAASFRNSATLTYSCKLNRVVPVSMPVFVFNSALNRTVYFKADNNVAQYEVQYRVVGQDKYQTVNMSANELNGMTNAQWNVLLGQDASQNRFKTVQLKLKAIATAESGLENSSWFNTAFVLFS